MNSAEFLRWLRTQGCTVRPSRGKGGHVEVTHGAKVSFVPTHGGRKELGTGLVNAIKRQLGLK